MSLVLFGSMEVCLIWINGHRMREPGVDHAYRSAEI